MGLKSASRKITIYSGTTVPLSIEINGIYFKEKDLGVLLISLDLLFVPHVFEESLQNYIYQNYKQDLKILLCASHTHFFPNIDRSKPLLGLVDDSVYNEVFTQLRKLSDLLLESESNGIDIEYHKSQLDLGIYRRKKTWRLNQYFRVERWMNLYPNPNIEIDDSLHLIKVVHKNGGLEAVLWNYGCHPVCFPEKGCISPEYPGYIRDMIRSHFKDPELPVIFLQGFSGNIRPRILEENPRGFKGRVKKLVNGISFSSDNQYQYDEWVNRLKFRVSQVLQESEFKCSTPKLEYSGYLLPLEKIFEGLSPISELSFARMSLSNNIHLIFVSAEVSNEYSKVLHQIFPNTNIIPIGCVGSVFGYLPTELMIKEGGYETEGFMKNFSLSGSFKGNIEETVCDAMKKIAVTNSL